MEFSSDHKQAPKVTRPARRFVVSDVNAISVALGTLSSFGWGLMLRGERESVFERGPAFTRHLFGRRAFGHGYLAMEITAYKDPETRENLHLLTISLPVAMGDKAVQKFSDTSDKVAEQLSHVGMLRSVEDVISASWLPIGSLGHLGTFRSLLKALHRSR